MFFIKKLIESILFPPGIIMLAFLFIALISFVELIRRKAKPAKYILIISLLFAVILYLSSIQPVSNMLSSPLETSYPVPAAKNIGKPDAIVVLSSGAYNRKTLDGDSFNRLFEGFRLYRKYHIPIIVSGGKATSTFSVAKIMRNILVETGVNKSLIITEDKSNDTYENALYVLRICKRRNFRRIILVTSAYHMPRAVLLFNAELTELKSKENNNGYKYKGIKIIPYPADFKTDLHYYNYNLYSYFPNLGYLVISEEALHEYVGYGYYYVKAKILKNY